MLEEDLCVQFIKKDDKNTKEENIQKGKLKNTFIQESERNQKPNPNNTEQINMAWGRKKKKLALPELKLSACHFSQSNIAEVREMQIKISTRNHSLPI